MAKNGLLIEYDYCTGCHSCEVACQQEHNYPAGTEYILETFQEKPSIYYLPFPTELCNLCAERTAQGEQPSCVKHCQAQCMTFGPIEELVKEMDKKSKMVLYSPF
ncbi:MAG: oxidoreductase [Deltaproteobacteria bacterium]|nr:oxidoreductase [Deltaproteobacteria bacterium]